MTDTAPAGWTPQELPSALAPLTALPNWLLWKWTQKNGKWTKPPYAVSGALASSTDPATWSSYEKVIGAINGYSGIGFALTDAVAIAAFDIDDCRDLETQKIHPRPPIGREVWQLRRSHYYDIGDTHPVCRSA